MHSQDIVHRDVKPENLLIEKGTDRLVLLDFNISREFDAKKHKMKTYTGVVQYIAPEVFQIELNKLMASYDNKVDVWSAGIVLYMMLCGVQPFFDEDIGKLPAKIMKEEPDYTLPAF